MSKYCPHDPFKKARQETGVLKPHMDGEDIPLILRHKELREAARDTATFSSDTPCRVPIPAEENVRSVRQLPIEVDPRRTLNTGTSLSRSLNAPMNTSISKRSRGSSRA